MYRELGVGFETFRNLIFEICVFVKVLYIRSLCVLKKKLY